MIKLLSILACVLYLQIYAQNDQFKYERKIDAVKNKWQKISLPPTIFKKVNKDFSDLRIIKTHGKDTTEVPYVFNLTLFEQQQLSLFKINESFKSNNYEVTLVNEEKRNISELYLKLSQIDFDYSFTIEGSMDQIIWKRLGDEQRVFNIQIDENSFYHSKIKFTNTNYKYLKLITKTKNKPIIEDVVVDFSTENKLKLNKIIIEDQEIKQIGKKTVIKLKLKDYQPIQCISFQVNGTNYFLRNFNLKFAKDTIRLRNDEMVRTFETSYFFELNSKTNNFFEFNPIYSNEIQIEIENLNDIPLQFSSIDLFGPKYELIFNPGNFNQVLLKYGSEIPAPEYDLIYFKDIIPYDTDEAALNIEKELKIDLKTKRNVEEKPYILYLSIGLIIVLIIIFIYLSQKEND